MIESITVNSFSQDLHYYSAIARQYFCIFAFVFFHYSSLHTQDSTHISTQRDVDLAELKNCIATLPPELRDVIYQKSGLNYVPELKRILVLKQLPEWVKTQMGKNKLGVSAEDLSLLESLELLFRMVGKDDFINDRMEYARWLANSYRHRLIYLDSCWGYGPNKNGTIITEGIAHVKDTKMSYWGKIKILLTILKKNNDPEAIKQLKQYYGPNFEIDDSVNYNKGCLHPNKDVWAFLTKNKSIKIFTYDTNKQITITEKSLDDKCDLIAFDLKGDETSLLGVFNEGIKTIRCDKNSCLTQLLCSSEQITSYLMDDYTIDDFELSQYNCDLILIRAKKESNNCLQTLLYSRKCNKILESFKDKRVRFFEHERVCEYHDLTVPYPNRTNTFLKFAKIE